MSFPERQYDHPRVHNHWTTVPDFSPGRLNATHLIYFNYSPAFPTREYSVLVESPSNASPNESDRYRQIGPLKETVRLPDVHFGQGFGSHAKIFVIPNHKSKYPSYEGDLVRGSTYTIKDGAPSSDIKGFKKLTRTGVR